MHDKKDAKARPFTANDRSPKNKCKCIGFFHKTDEFTVKFLTFNYQWFILSFNLTNLNFYRIRKKEKNFLRRPSTYTLEKSKYLKPRHRG